MRNFIHDMIHMTEGQKLVNYWWLWLSILFGIIIFVLIKDVWRKRK